MRIAVIGAGASGLAFAISLKIKNPAARVTVFERLDSPGKKLLATGNGRCNLSNSAACAEKYSNDFASGIIDVKETLDFFNSLGLKTREDSEGRIYPYSNRAQSVVDILCAAANQNGVEIITGVCIKSCKKHGGRFILNSEFESYTADCLVVAAGGKASPALGSNGSGYEILTSFGHTLATPLPALVQLTSPNRLCRVLKGERSKCKISIVAGGKTVFSQSGEILFTSYGISGIAALNAGTCVAKAFNNNPNEKICALIDFAPDFSESEIAEHFEKFKNLTGITGGAISNEICRQCGGDSSLAAKCCKAQKFIISGTKSFDFAQLTSGGIAPGEFTKNLESKKVKNLFAVGEVLDIDAQCGGFNLQWAWSSAVKAADYIAGGINND